MQLYVGYSSLKVTKVTGYHKGESLFDRTDDLLRRGREMLFSLYHVRTCNTDA